MTESLTVLLAAVGAVAAILAVLLPVVLLQGKSLRREITLQRTNLDAAMANLRADLAEVRNGTRVDLAAAVPSCAPIWRRRATAPVLTWRRRATAPAPIWPPP